MVWACPNNPDTVQLAAGIVRSAVAAWTQAGLLELNHVEYPLWPTNWSRFPFYLLLSALPRKPRKLPASIFRR